MLCYVCYVILCMLGRNASEALFDQPGGSVGPTGVPIGSQRGPQPKNPFLPSKFVTLRDFWGHHTGDTSKGS
jgi:hypothetical protein